MTDKSSLEYRRADFVKRSPYLYRLSVVTVFRDIYKQYKRIDDHPLGALKYIIQDMASYYDGHPDELKGSFSKKLGNILSGETEGTRNEDIDHFELIEEFLWRHEPEEISMLEIVNEVNYLAKFFTSFTKPKMVKQSRVDARLDIGKTNDTYMEDEGKLIILKTIEEGHVFKFIHTSESERKQYRLTKNRHVVESLIDNYYLAIKKSRFIDEKIAILFSDSLQSEFCFGCYLEKNNLLIMKHHQTLKPMFLEYLKAQITMPGDMGKVSIFDIKTNVDISPFGIISPIYYPEDEKYKCINYSGLDTVKDIRERDLAIQKANEIYKTLREN
jgi:hypothetical protein